MNFDQPTTEIEHCEHRRVTHRHGTRVGYTICKCRCDECSAATARYGKWHHRQRAKRQLSTVPADAARAHLIWLTENGMGSKRIRKMSGLGSNITRLLWPQPNRPAKRIKRETERRILEVELDVADGHPVDAAEAEAIVEELLLRGWSKAAIGRSLTGNPSTYSLQIGRAGQVHARNLRTLRTLLFKPVPEALHGPTGRMVDKDTGHRGFVSELGTTTGVPLEPSLDTFQRRLRIQHDRDGLLAAVRESIDRHGLISPLVRDLVRR